MKYPRENKEYKVSIFLKKQNFILTKLKSLKFKFLKKSLKMQNKKL